MKRILLALVCVCCAASGFAQETIGFVTPKDPRIMALGGAFTATGTGYQSLYGNPAGFASSSGEFTLLSVIPWVYVSPTQENIQTITMAIDGQDDQLLSRLAPLITENGIGAGASIGLGWVGKGLGLGVLGGAEAYLRGRNALGAVGTMGGQIEAVVGVGFPLSLFGATLSVGGDLRPFMRVTGPISAIQLAALMNGGDMAEILGDTPVYLGFGLAVDLGARMDFGRFLSVGLSIRDITTKQSYSQYRVADLPDAIAGNTSSSVTAEFSILPVITAGATLRPIPEALSGFVDLALSLELQDPVGAIKDKLTFWHMVHAGVEASFFKGFLSLRGGLNRGYLSAGFGLDLFILEANVAVFTEELGIRPGDKPRTGVSMDIAIRF